MNILLFAPCGLTALMSVWLAEFDLGSELETFRMGLIGVLITGDTLKRFEAKFPDDFEVKLSQDFEVT